jgi:hypothetical protein
VHHILAIVDVNHQRASALGNENVLVVVNDFNEHAVGGLLQRGIAASMIGRYGRTFSDASARCSRGTNLSVTGTAAAGTIRFMFFPWGLFS